MGSLYDALAQIPDYRDPRGVRYKLADLHFMIICAVLCNHLNAVEMAYYMEENLENFRKLLGIEAAPSHDTISRVFIHTDWTYLTKHLAEWITMNYPSEHILRNNMRVLHIDGKAIRSSANKGDGEKPPYLLNNMWEGETIGIVSLPVNDKSNEITAIPKLLDFLDIHGAIVTIDAIGMQREIVARILSKKGHFMIPVKENQRTLLESIEAERNRLIAEKRWDSLPRCVLKKLGHGRIEEYTLTVIRENSFLLEEFSGDDPFLSIARIGYLEKKTTDKKSGKISFSSVPIATDLCCIEPETFLGIRLSHWNIESQHWKLDVQLDEDHQRQRMGNSRSNMSALRRFVMALAKDKEHPKWTVPRFMTHCQNDFDGMVGSILKFAKEQKEEGKNG